MKTILALFAITLIGCVTPISPDEFHLWGSRAEGEGAYQSRHGPLAFDGGMDTDTIGLGFTWYLSVPRSSETERELLEEVRSLRIDTAVRQPPPAPTVLAVPLTDGPAVQPVPVTVDGASEDVWVKLIGALAALAAALGAYLGRRHIPVIRNIGKAKKDPDLIRDRPAPETDDGLD